MYEELSKGYDELYGEEQLKKLNKIKHLLKGRILDIGAGTGIVARHFKNVVSLDPCKEMLDKAPGKKVIGKAEKLPFKEGEFDTIVLACTHYPLVWDIFSDVVGDGIEIFNPAVVVAEEVAKRFDGDGESKVRFVISKDSQFFRQKVNEVFGSDGYIIDVLK